MGGNELRREIIAIGEGAGARSIGVAFYDYQTRTGWSYHGDTWFHAASTIKVPVLVGVFGAIRDGRFTTESRLHVRNRFLSAHDGTPYRVAADRDANSAVHAQIGRTMKIRELAHHMISTSSNLATNLLVDLVGVGEIRDTLEGLGINGIELHRGVEDERAWEAGLNNRVTANGLLETLRRIAEKRAFSEGPASRCWKFCTPRNSRAASRPDFRTMRGSPTRPAKSLPSRMMRASFFYPIANLMSS